MIYIYQIIGLILIPLIKLNIKIRINKNKEIVNRHKERFGISNYAFQNNNQIIWIHAASVGEFKSADYFIIKYHKKFNILITTTTVSAAEYAINNYGDKIIHQFAPLDVSIWINKFLDKWKPLLIIWIESDLWPMTLKIIKKKKIKAILVNLRLSPKSLKKWQLIPSFYNNLLNSFSDIFAQSIIDRDRIKLLSNKKIKFIGNLKLSMTINDENKNLHQNNIYQNNIVNIMLSSTHSNEEEKLVPIIKKLINEYKKLRIFIAPRHPNRAEEIVSLCLLNNLPSQLESENNSNSKKIVVINSFGILEKYFIKSDIVFLGGSLVPAGGHNPIEPAIHKCAILTGPQIFNWENIYSEMLDKSACIKIASIEDFNITLKDLLRNKNKIEILKNNAHTFSKKTFIDVSILDEIIDNLTNINNVKST